MMNSSSEDQFYRNQILAIHCNRNMHHWHNRDNRPLVLCRMCQQRLPGGIFYKDAFKIFPKFTGVHLRGSLFFN